MIDVSLVDTVGAVDGVRVGGAVGERDSPRSSARTATRLGGNGPPTIAASWTQDDTLNPWTVASGRRARARRRGRHRQAGRRGRQTSQSATRSPCSRPTRSSSSIVGILTIGGERQPRPRDVRRVHLRPGAAAVHAERGQGLRDQRRRRRRCQPGRARRATSTRCCPTASRRSPATTSPTRTTRTSTTTSSASSRRSCWCSPASRCSSRRSASTTRSRSSSPSARASRRCCGRSVRRARRCSGRSRSRRSRSDSSRRSSACSPASASPRGCARCSTRSASACPPARSPSRPSTVIAAFVVGMVVTLLATVFPAIRASRVPPIAALRDVAIERTRRVA